MHLKAEEISKVIRDQIKFEVRSLKFEVQNARVHSELLTSNF